MENETIKVGENEVVVPKLQRVATLWWLRVLHKIGIYPKSTSLSVFAQLINKEQPITVSLYDPDTFDKTTVILLGGANLSLKQAKHFQKNMELVINQVEAFSGR